MPNSQIAVEVSNREQSDSEALQQIESQLLDLQPLISADSFSSEVNSANDEKIGTNGIEAEVAVGASTTQMSNTELSEYILRVRSRKKPTPLDDRDRDLYSANGNHRRTNWLLGDDNGGTDRKGGANGFASNTQKSNSVPQNEESNQLSVSRERREATGADVGPIDVEDGEDGEEVGQLREQKRNTNSSSNDILATHRESDKAVPDSTSFIGEELDADGADDAEADEGEDEAELLLAALGGRTH